MLINSCCPMVYGGGRKSFGCGYFSTTAKYSGTKHLALGRLLNDGLKGRDMRIYPGVLLMSGDPIQPA
jgi:hypothetical protein